MAMVFMISCNGGSNDTVEVQDNSVVARTVHGSEGVSVQPLDAPGNPYADMYADWDIWVYENASSQPKAYKPGEIPAELVTLVGRVTMAGYLVPHMEYERLRHEAIKDGTWENFNNQFAKVYAEGLYEKSKLDEKYRESQKIGARYFPEIPSWLVASPPAGGAMLFPNGDVVTYGMLGSADDPDAETCCGGSGLPWCRYSPDGELINSSTLSWWHCFYESGESSMPEGTLNLTRIDGYVYFTSADGDEILSVWDYDGTRLEANTLPPPRDWHPFASIMPATLELLYELQQEAGTSQG
jgi:hypothetical protein